MVQQSSAVAHTAIVLREIARVLSAKGLMTDSDWMAVADDAIGQAGKDPNSDEIIAAIKALSEAL